MEHLKIFIRGFLLWFDSLPDPIQIFVYAALGTIFTMLGEDIQSGRVDFPKYWVVLSACVGNIIIYEGKKLLGQRVK